MEMDSSVGRCHPLTERVKGLIYCCDTDIKTKNDSSLYRKGKGLLIDCLETAQKDKTRFVGNVTKKHDCTINIIKWFVCRYPSLLVAYVAFVDVCNTNVYEYHDYLSTAKSAIDLNNNISGITEQERLMFGGTSGVGTLKDD